jgi:PilZ domain
MRDRRQHLRMTERDRRRQPRTSIALPVRVHAQYPDGAVWDETTSTMDASAGGLAIPLSRTVLLGQALYLSLPLPKRFRTFDLTAPSYHVYAVVASVVAGGAVGVRFIGKNPPGGYTRNEAGLFLNPPTIPPAPERRAASRRDGVFFFVLKPRGERGDRQEEATVADNLGTGGARVMTTQFFAKGEVLEVEEAGGPFATPTWARTPSGASTSCSSTRRRRRGCSASSVHRLLPIGSAPCAPSSSRLRSSRSPPPASPPRRAPPST